MLGQAGGPLRAKVPLVCASGACFGAACCATTSWLLEQRGRRQKWSSRMALRRRRALCCLLSSVASLASSSHAACSAKSTLSKHLQQCRRFINLSSASVRIIFLNIRCFSCPTCAPGRGEWRSPPSHCPGTCRLVVAGRTPVRERQRQTDALLKIVLFPL